MKKTYFRKGIDVMKKKQALNSEVTIYEKLFGIKPGINLMGGITYLGGSVPPSEVEEAAKEASQYFVDMYQLLRRSGEVVAETLGVPAAYITTGSSAGLALSAAACIAKTDPEIIARLPITEGLKNEIIVQKGHYPYNNMLRIPGAKLIYVGEETPKNNYPYPGGVEYPWYHKFNNQPEHIEEAINDNTCALYYVINGNLYEGSRDLERGDPGRLEGEVPLVKVSEIAKKHNLPLIIDAADQIPPITNTKKLVDIGGGLVIFSGGKAIQSYNDGGFIVGRKDLIEAVIANGPPNHTIGRGFKISKEQIVAQTVAIQRYCNLDIDAELAQEKARCEFILHLVKDLPHVKSTLLGFPETDWHDEYAAIIELDEENLGMTAKEVAEKLRAGDPPIWTNNYKFHEGKLWLRAKVWKDYQGIRIFAERLKKILTKN